MVYRVNAALKKCGDREREVSIGPEEKGKYRVLAMKSRANAALKKCGDIGRGR